MSEAFVFGYGSLVNRATHEYMRTHPARLPGWRRRWCHAAGREVAFLSVVEAPGHEIDGVIAPVPDGDWPALDERERWYQRVPGETVEHGLGTGAAVQFYHAPQGMHAPAEQTLPILLSYLDVVLQGFLTEFGEPGVARFFETTDGWEAPVRDDRTQPVYRRHQRLSEPERHLVDRWLSDLGVHIL